MAKAKRKLPYGLWETEITPEKVFSDMVVLSEARAVGNITYWLELRPSEGGRTVLVRRNQDGVQKDITPEGFNLRTRVHEYGGGVFTLYNDSLCFVNFEDQRIYYQKTITEEAPIPLTPQKNADGSLGKYAALEVSPDGKTLVFVYEKEYERKENKNFIALLRLDIDKVQEPVILAQGNDFYGDPKISPSGKYISWLTWNHPKMPWDSTQLVLALFDGKKVVSGSERKIAGGLDKSICQTKFDWQDRLYFVMDEATNDPGNPKSWWNLYRYSDGEVIPITAKKREFGEPLWTFGNSRYDFISDGKIICTYLEKGKGRLAKLDPESGNLEVLSVPLENFAFLEMEESDHLVFIGSSPDQVTSVMKLNLNSLVVSILKKSSPVQVNRDDLSISRTIEYTTSDGGCAYAHFYFPNNSKFEGPEGKKPPLIVMAHGGPTSQASTAMSLARQFWTSQGYALLDVDYRGSTGYGRNYRDALLGKWGLVDAADIADGVRYLITQGMVNPSQIAIRGGSAGGYAVQRALTEFPDLFQCGASYYGIGDLEKLAKLTHKFESHYLTGLLGKSYPAGKALYKERSPINHLDRLKSPMIILQGSDDRIVRPEVSQQMARALKNRGIVCEYIEYPGETHGFRKKESNIDALRKEARFYRKNLRVI